MPSVASSATPSRTQTAAFSVLWRSSFSSGCDALQARHEAEQNLAVGHNGQLSLVQLLVGDSQLVTLMNWRSIEPLSGQCVQIDKWGGVIYSPPSLRPFSELHCIAPQACAPSRWSTTRQSQKAFSSRCAWPNFASQADVGGRNRRRLFISQRHACQNVPVLFCS